MTDHWSIVAEGAGLAILLGATIALWWRGRREELRGQTGWLAILAGLVSFSLGIATDLADELGFLQVPGGEGLGLLDVFRDLVFPGLGVLLLAIGLLCWIPLPLRLESAREELARANEQLEARVEEATQGLVEANDRLEGERSSLAFFRAMMDRSTDAIFIADPEEGRFIDVNRTACERLGYDREELLSMRVRDIHVSLDDEAWQARVDRLREEGAVTVDGEHRHKDGSPIPVEISIQHVSYGGDEHVLALARDIRERVEGQRRLQRAQEIANVGDWTQELASGDQTWSDQLFEITGRDRGEGPGGFDWLLDHVHPNDRDALKDVIAAVETGESGPFHVEYRFRRDDGETRWIQARVHVQRGPDGQPVRLVGTNQDITQRKRLEQELDERKEQLETTIGTTDMVLYSVDPDGVFTLSDGRGLQQLGLEPGEVVGQHIEDVYADHPEILDAFEDALQGEPSSFEVEVAGVWWASQFVPRLDGDGTLTAVDGVAVDVTDRVEAERRLQESEERFRQMAENIESVFWLTPPEKAEMLYASPAYEEIWGRSVDSLYEDPVSFLDAIHPNDRDRVQERLPGQTEGTYDVEYRVVQPDGEIRWVHDRAFPITDDSGDVVRVAGIATDITERVEAEHQLREANELFDTIAENLEAVLYKTGTAVSEMEYVSPAAEDIFGVDAETIVEEPERLMETVAPEDRERLAQKFSQPPTGEPVEAQVDHPTKGRRWVRASSYPIGDGEGDPEAWVGIATDITEERRMLALQQESARVARKLEQAREMEAFKDRFLNMAAHELVTPLTPLRFQLDALQEGVVGEPSEEQLEALSVADRSVDRLEHQIGNLVDATDLQAGDLELEPMPADLLEIVEDGLDLADRLHGEGLTMEAHLAGSTSLVADGERLGRAVTSVVLEAAEHRGDPTDSIHVELETDGERARLTIEISSADIGATEIEELFEPFEGVEDHEDVEAEGTGLGLFVARGVIEAHGGSIDTSSDGGLRFRIEIPLGDQVES